MESKLWDKIYACWLGKNIGGTLGAPVEGCMEVMNLTFYPVLEGGALPNDDLDLQLLNLHALEQHGLATNAEAIANEWAEHVRFPWDEYGYSLTAMRQGFKAPYAGWYDNPFRDCMGSPIRSEIWAAVANGNPALAAYFAWQDAVVDHAGGEGVYGEMFYAALETMALYEQDTQLLVEKALAYVPENSRVYKAVKDTLAFFRAGVPYEEIRDRILEGHGSPNFTDAPQNIAFSIVGLLYGKDFEDGMLKTVNLGYDTDCTVATLGSLYGLLYGTQFIPEKWSAPIGDKIAVSAAVIGLDAPADLTELTQRTLRMAEMLAACDTQAYRIDSEEAEDISRQVYTFPAGDPKKNMTVTLRYEGEGACVPGGEKKVLFILKNNSKGPWEAELSLDMPQEYEEAALSVQKLRLEPGEETTVTACLRAGQEIPARAELRLNIDRLHNGYFWKRYTLPFTLLRAHRWMVDGKEKYLDGTRVEFTEKREDGRYTATTTLYVPTGRNCKLMAASADPITVRMNGETIIDDADKETFMPAYHRCPSKQAYCAQLEAGLYALEVTVTSPEKPAMFYLNLLGPDKEREPGNYYAMVDAEIGG